MERLSLLPGMNTYVSHFHLLIQTILINNLFFLSRLSHEELEQLHGNNSTFFLFFVCVWRLPHILITFLVIAGMHMSI